MLGKGRSNVDSETNPFVVGRWKVIGSAGSKLTGIDKAKKKKKKKKKEEVKRGNNGTKTRNKTISYCTCTFTDFNLAAVFFFFNSGTVS